MNDKMESNLDAATRVNNDELELERLKRLNDEVELEMRECFAELDQIPGNLVLDPEDLEQLQEARPTAAVHHVPMPAGLRC